MSIGGKHQTLRLQVLERDAWLCQLGYPGCLIEATEADHIRPRALGGAHELDNYRAACRPCNASSGGRLGNQRKRAARRHPFFTA